MSLQIAVAETIDWKAIDWESAPRIGSKQEFSRYIEDKRRNGQNIFYIVLTNGLKVDTEYEFANLSPIAHLKFHCEPTHECFFEITEYPGTNVANAYRNCNTSKLTSEERKLYRKAVQIISEANKRTSEVEKARYIHDEICKMVITPASTVEGEKMIDSKGKLISKVTASGALLKHEANCQGYSDAFYMLGRMSGLNVGRIRGKVRGDNHQWNTIKLNGKIYFVDVTQDDVNNTDRFFMRDLETMRHKYSYEWEIIPNLQ